MKTTLLFLAFLLCASYFAAADLDPVLEPSHHKLLTGVEYFIIPFGGASIGGGLALGSARNKTCPLDVDVVQHRSNYEKGIGMTFHPVNLKKGVSDRVIRESTNLIIKFSSAKKCARSTIWKVDTYDKLRKRYFVTIGGAEGDGKSPNGWFRIKKQNYDYKLVYCSQVQCITAPCNVICKNVGAYYEQGRNLLALTEEPLVFMFQEVFKG